MEQLSLEVRRADYALFETFCHDPNGGPIEIDPSQAVTSSDILRRRTRKECEENASRESCLIFDQSILVI